MELPKRHAIPFVGARHDGFESSTGHVRAVVDVLMILPLKRRRRICLGGETRPGPCPDMRGAMQDTSRLHGTQSSGFRETRGRSLVRSNSNRAPHQERTWRRLKRSISRSQGSGRFLVSGFVEAGGRMPTRFLEKGEEQYPIYSNPVIGGLLHLVFRPVGPVTMSARSKTSARNLTSISSNIMNSMAPM